MVHYSCISNVKNKSRVTEQCSNSWMWMCDSSWMNHRLCLVTKIFIFSMQEQRCFASYYIDCAPLFGKIRRLKMNLFIIAESSLIFFNVMAVPWPNGEIKKKFTDWNSGFYFTLKWSNYFMGLYVINEIYIKFVD